MRSLNRFIVHSLSSNPPDKWQYNGLPELASVQGIALFNINVDGKNKRIKKAVIGISDIFRIFFDPGKRSAKKPSAP